MSTEHGHGTTNRYFDDKKYMGKEIMNKALMVKDDLASPDGGIREAVDHLIHEHGNATTMYGFEEQIDMLEDIADLIEAEQHQGTGVGAQTTGDIYLSGILVGLGIALEAINTLSTKGNALLMVARNIHAVDHALNGERADAVAAMVAGADEQGH